MGLRDKIREWVFGIALKKVAKRTAAAVVALVTGAAVAPKLAEYGVQVDPGTLQGAVSAAVFAGVEFLRNYLKNKKGVKWL